MTRQRQISLKPERGVSDAHQRADGDQGRRGVPRDRPNAAALARSASTEFHQRDRGNAISPDDGRETRKWASSRGGRHPSSYCSSGGGSVPGQPTTNPPNDPGRPYPGPPVRPFRSHPPRRSRPLARKSTAETYTEEPLVIT